MRTAFFPFDLSKTAVVITFICLFGHQTVIGQTSIGSEIESRKALIRNLLSEKKDTQELIDELKGKEWGVIEILEVLKNNIKINQRKLSEITDRISLVEASITGLTRKIKNLEQSIKTDEGRVKKQLLALFYMRKIKDLTLFLAAQSLENYFRNQRLVQLNVELDAEMVQRLKTNRESLRKGADHLKSQKVELAALRKREIIQKNTLAFEKDQQYLYLYHLREDKSIRVKYLLEIQVELEKLNDTLYTLEQKKQDLQKEKQFKGLNGKKGRLPSPVRGKLVHRFERKSSQYFMLFKRGVLVETEQNAEVNSILGGKVVWSGPFQGYGNLVILDHGKGSLSVYGNLDEVYVIVDDVIDQGYQLGTVAKNELENRYLFYFETRFNKTAVNPEQWLKKPRWN